MKLLLNAGLASPLFVTNNELTQCHLDSPHVLVCQGELTLELLAEFFTVQNQQGTRSFFGALFGSSTKSVEPRDGHVAQTLSSLLQLAGDLNLDNVPSLSAPLLVVADSLNPLLLLALLVAKLRGIWKTAAVQLQPSGVYADQVMNWLDTQGSDVSHVRSSIRTYAPSDHISFFGGQGQAVIGFGTRHSRLAKAHPEIPKKIENIQRYEREFELLLQQARDVLEGA